MSNEVAKQEQSIDPKIFEQLALGGDLSGLNSEQKIQYFNKVCETLGLNPLTKPFEIMKLQGREILYARKDATDQLRKLYSISVKDSQVDKQGDYLIARTVVEDAKGRQDTAMGVVFVGKSNGAQLANDYMKAETKAKRRATLSICGLGVMDESEVENAKQVQHSSSNDKLKGLMDKVEGEQNGEKEQDYDFSYDFIVKCINAEESESSLQQLYKDYQKAIQASPDYEAIVQAFKEKKQQLQEKPSEQSDDQEKEEPTNDFSLSEHLKNYNEPDTRQDDEVEEISNHLKNHFGSASIALSKAKSLGINYQSLKKLSEQESIDNLVKLVG